MLRVAVFEVGDEPVIVLLFQAETDPTRYLAWNSSRLSLME